MKWFLIIIFMVMTGFGYENNHILSNDINNAIQQELELYPKSTLIDIYKSFFQGYWGPGHMVSDSLNAEKYIEEELTDMAACDTVMVKQLGTYKRYVRINLLFIEEGFLSKKDLLHAFIASANTTKKTSIEDWKTEWNIILSTIKEMNVLLPHFEEDEAKLEKLLSESKYVVHHSEEFVKEYNPHYRVISIEEFNKLREKLPGKYRLN